MEITYSRWSCHQYDCWFTVSLCTNRTDPWVNITLTGYPCSVWRRGLTTCFRISVLFLANLSLINQSVISIGWKIVFLYYVNIKIVIIYIYYFLSISICFIFISTIRIAFEVTEILCTLWRVIVKCFLQYFHFLFIMNINEIYVCEIHHFAYHFVLHNKPFPETMLTHCQLDPWEQTTVTFDSEVFFFQENVFVNVVCILLAILVMLQYVDICSPQ